MNGLKTFQREQNKSTEDNGENGIIVALDLKSSGFKKKQKNPFALYARIKKT